MSWAWLPDRQLHIVETLGHVDAQIAELHQRVLAYTAIALDLREVRLPDRFRLEVAGIAPLPAGISRLAADILNGLRGALEHALMAEVVAAAGRQLTPEEEKAVEFPLTKDIEAWVRRSRHRKSHKAFEVDKRLIERMQQLQPGDDQTHALRLLAEHTNLAKHRVPAIVATQHAAVTIVDKVTGGVTLDRCPRPIAVGDIIAETRNMSEIDSFTYVAVARPHTGEMVVLLTEVAAIERWIREVAVPLLITGRKQDPPLPSALSVLVGHGDVRAALEDVADVQPAAVRGQAIAGHAIVRAGLIEILLERAEVADHDAVRGWVETLDFESTKRRLVRLQTAAERGRGEEEAQQVIRIAVRWTRT